MNWNPNWEFVKRNSHSLRIKIAINQYLFLLMDNLQISWIHLPYLGSYMNMCLRCWSIKCYDFKIKVLYRREFGERRELSLYFMEPPFLAEAVSPFAFAYEVVSPLSEDTEAPQFEGITLKEQGSFLMSYSYPALSPDLLLESNSSMFQEANYKVKFRKRWLKHQRNWRVLLINLWNVG